MMHPHVGLCVGGNMRAISRFRWDWERDVHLGAALTPRGTGYRMLA